MLNLTHVRLLVTDIESCTTFYRDVLGFDVVVDVSGIYVELDAGNARLGLYKADLMAERVGTASRPLDSNAQDRVCLTFDVDDVDATVSELSERGAEVVTAPHDEEEWVLRVAHIRDPAGNLIEINAPLQR